MTAPVSSSELGKIFWKNVRLGNIICEFYEKPPSGRDGRLTAADGTLLMGEYHPRPTSPKPLDSNCTRTGEVRLRFRVKGARPGVHKECRVQWNYIGHGQNRDSMLGKIPQPWVLEILKLLDGIRIPDNEGQSATVLKCKEAASTAGFLIRGRKPNGHDPTDQVHVIIKLHRVLTAQEIQSKFECGNQYDFSFLRGRMYTKNWREFPVPLAFSLETLLTHPTARGDTALIRRSVLVTEAKGEGLNVGAFLNNRFSNPNRYPVTETMHIIFKVFMYVLKLQLDTLETEGALLGDLHEENITVTWCSFVWLLGFKLFWVSI